MPVPEPAYIIRRAQTDDLPAIAAVELAANELFRDSAEAWILSDSGRDAADYVDWLRVGVIWVAVFEDAVVGFAAVETIDGQAYLHELDVHPAHGRRGLGRRLIATACDAARGAGQRALRLSTFRHIPWNAPYYVRLGFRELPEIEWGPGLHAVWRGEIEAGLDPDRRVMLELRW